MLIDYYVESKNQGLVGFSVFGNKKMPLQLEFYSIDGLKEISGIPENFHKGKKQNMNE